MSRRTHRLSVNVPETLRRLLYPQGQPMLGLRPATALTLAVLLSFASWMTMPKFQLCGESGMIEVIQTPTASLPSPTTDQLIVYLDTSASMAGYVSPDGQNVFGLTLRALRDVATAFKQPVQIAVRDVDVTVEDPDPDGALALQKASINPAIYRGSETDLAGAFNTFDPKQAQIAASPPARFHILITDGVQSTKSQNIKLACLKGSDPTCVRERIIALLKQGWGGYVIGLRSQFHGKVYSEVSGGAIQYDTTEGALKRYRPFYLYIFSPDRPALDEFVDVLRERLRSAISGQDALHVLALTSPYATATAKADISVPDEAKDVVKLSGEQLDSPPRFTLAVNSDEDEAMPAPFVVAVNVPWSSFVRDNGTPQELAKLLRWEIEALPLANGNTTGADTSMRYAVVKLKNGTGEPTLDDQGRLIVQATVGWPRSTAKPGCCTYRLQSRLDLSMGHEPLPWIKQWSTDLDTTAAVGDRTLNLESVLTDLWRNPVLEQQMVTTAYLRVGPK